MKIRNIAIIAHVDHGKTTLVDGLLKQTHTFRENEAEMQQTTIMDNNDLERERGITILSKNTSIFYNDVKVNIIDTPGHADFGGEVERVLNMADGAFLIVDAAEGPLPQTKFVLQKALQTGLKVILVINKVDKKDARPEEVLKETEELFLKLATQDDHLSFPVVYAIGREGKAGLSPDKLADDLKPLLDLAIEYIPEAVGDVNGPVQVQISTLDYDDHLGKLGVGRLRRGTLKKGQNLSILDETGVIANARVEKLFITEGMHRVEASEAICGDIVTLAGAYDIKIGQTLTDPSAPDALPAITVSEPTLKVTIGANTSPFAGKDGKYVTSRQVGERLKKEMETNLGLRFKDLGGAQFEVSGRGELHLAVLIENMRREGYELQVSKPQVIFREENGVKSEPFEEVTIDVSDEYVGAVTTEMGRRRAKLADMSADGKGNTRIIYEISQRNLMGARNILLTLTKGTILFNTISLGYKPVQDSALRLRNGVIVACDNGQAAAYSLENAQERGQLFIEPGMDVYEGMIVGLNTRENDMELNVTKDKQKTNMRSATKEMKISLTPPVIMSLEQALDFVEDDELIEATPKNLRLRKKFLTKQDRVRNSRASS